MKPTRLLLVFVKEPLPGLVKTRLAEGFGADTAVAIYRAMVRLLLRQLSGLQECHVRFCYAPDDADEAVRFWLLPEIIDSAEIDLPLDHLDFHPQGEGDLGHRLARATNQAFSEGFEKVAVIGSDCIQLSSRWVHAALVQLNDRHDAVIGPSPDGGYHLLATKRYHPALFEDIPWSSPRTYQATLQRAEEQQLRPYALPPLPDIDTPDDYEQALSGPLGKRLRQFVREETG